MLVVVAILVLISACAGQPQVVEKVETVEVEKIVTVEVEKEVEKIVTVEVEAEAAAPEEAAEEAAPEAAQAEGKWCSGTNIVFFPGGSPGGRAGC